MSENIVTNIMDLKSMPLEELQKKYEEVFDGKKAPSNNKVFLCRKIAYRLQEAEFGGLSFEAKKKLEELIQKYDPANNILLRPENKQPSISRKPLPNLDRRLPIPGSIITKNYKGKKIEVKVLENGFEYNGRMFRTLSALASEIAGQHWNGYAFFRLE